jgi:putative hemin transport protein
MTAKHSPQNPTALRDAYLQARGQGLRAKDAAEHLGISEGQALLACAVHPMSPETAAPVVCNATVLDEQWLSQLQGLEAVGTVMALTRNEHVVHERIGVYQRVTGQGGIGMALGPDIDLRLFLRQWHAGFHVVEHKEGHPPAESLQYFDRAGRAVHKVHLRAASDRQAFAALVATHSQVGRSVLFEAAARTPSAPLAMLANAQIDRQELANDWAAMRDTHEFFDLLKRHGVGREQSFQLMEGQHTELLHQGAIEQLLRSAARAAVPLMVFVGNAGCLQIHTGDIERVLVHGEWVNVMDDAFNLHMRHTAVARAWLVHKPTDDGVVTSVEAFDADGDLLMMCFGARKPGQPERADWRALTESLRVRPWPDLARLSGEAA